MRNFKTSILFFLLSLCSLQTHAAATNQTNKDLDIESLIGPFDAEKIKKGLVLCQSKVDDFEEKKQKLDFNIAGLHPKDCRFALRKLSLYEKYSEYIGLVKQASYNEKNQRIRLLLSSTLLPFNMIMDFKLPRITTTGSYQFSFDQGFLNGLAGTINVYEYQNRCLFYSTAQWQGPHTGISSTIFQLFSSTLGKMTMETLFRISSTY
jgi:hypothetical protein